MFEGGADRSGICLGHDEHARSLGRRRGLSKRYIGYFGLQMSAGCQQVSPHWRVPISSEIGAAIYRTLSLIPPNGVRSLIRFGLHTKAS